MWSPVRELVRWNGLMSLNHDPSSSRMLEKSVSFVLASFRPSTRTRRLTNSAGAHRLECSLFVAP